MIRPALVMEYLQPKRGGAAAGRRRGGGGGGSAVANVANTGDVDGSESVEESDVSHHVEVQEVDGGMVHSVADVAAS